MRLALFDFAEEDGCPFCARVKRDIEEVDAFLPLGKGIRQLYRGKADPREGTISELEGRWTVYPSMVLGKSLILSQRGPRFNKPFIRGLLRER